MFKTCVFLARGSPGTARPTFRLWCLLIPPPFGQGLTRRCPKRVGRARRPRRAGRKRRRMVRACLRLSPFHAQSMRIPCSRLARDGSPYPLFTVSSDSRPLFGWGLTRIPALCLPAVALWRRLALALRSPKRVNPSPPDTCAYTPGKPLARRNWILRAVGYVTGQLGVRLQSVAIAR